MKISLFFKKVNFWTNQTTGQFFVNQIYVTQMMLTLIISSDVLFASIGSSGGKGALQEVHCVVTVVQHMPPLCFQKKRKKKFHFQFKFLLVGLEVEDIFLNKKKNLIEKKIVNIFFSIDCVDLLARNSQYGSIGI